MPALAVASPPAKTSVLSDRLILGIVVAGSLALRLPDIGRAYWIDEGITVGISSHHLGAIPHLLTEDGSPPLFYGLLHFWMRLFGTSPVATHALTLLISLAAVPVAYWAGRVLFDRRAGLAAAVLVACNPFLNWYSTETRMYPLVIVLAMAGLAFAWRAFRDRRFGDSAAAVACYTALIYTHNWGLYLTLVTAGVLFALALAGRDRGRATGVIVASGAVLVLWLPWAPTFVAQARSTAAPWAVSPQITDFFADAATATGGTIGLVVLPLVAFGAIWTNRRRRTGATDVAGFAGAIAVLTLLAGFLGAQLDPSWTVRYLAVTVGPFLLAAAGALAYTRPGRTVIAAMSALVVGWSIVGALLPNPNRAYAKSNVAVVARQAAPLLRPGDLVVVTQTEQLAVLAHYLPKGLHYLTPTGPVTDPSVVDWRNIVARLDAASPCTALSPAIQALPVGASVLEVDPAKPLGTSGTAWAQAVASAVSGDEAYLAGDPSLVVTGVFAPALKPKPYSPVYAYVYRKVAGPEDCP
jgi:4-amino-4-deoxy-L-arabinose transferase-like glycosyltransferase